MTHQEINEAVARKLGWKLIKSDSERSVYPERWYPPNMDSTKSMAYSTSIEAAWEILDHWQGDYIVGRQNGKFHCTLFRPSEEFEAWADTAPMAICLAFLKLSEDAR